MPKERHFEPKCDEKDGSFLPKQCVGKMCACVDPSTGIPIENAIGSAERLGCIRGRCF